VPIGVRLGPFELDAPIGQGGMGVVWRARHVGEGTPVAVKVLTTEHARRRAYVTAFRNEVHAAVGLDHPFVAAVFDLGVIPREAEIGSEGALVAGSPYLVMEYAHGGSLEAACGTLRWAEVRGILLGLLDALGHAHARGLVHRDVKPGNVLLADARDGRPGIRLTDFGLAHADRDDRTDSAEPVAGTPRYMAPEQLEGRWRDQGPWTDLYSLGRLALALLMGALDAPWRPQPVPAGFSAWVARLLEPVPRDRFALAADAAHGLRRLGSDLVDDTATLRALVGEVGPREGEGRTISMDAAPEGPKTQIHLRAALAEWARPAPVLPAERVIPPMPRLPPDAEEIPRPLPVALGLQVFPLRTLPLLGRQAERSALWDDLRSVRQDGRPRLVLLHGPAGTGKSRLAQWMCEQAMEAGAATVLRASAGAGGGDGIARMLSRHLGCAGLTPAAVRERVRRLLEEQSVTDPYEWQALSALIAPDPSPPEGVAVRFANAEERYVLVARHLKRLSRVRPVVLWLDDVQWSPEALRFVQHVLDRPLVEVLIVATVRDDVLVEQPESAELIERLAAHPLASRLAVDPLPPADHAELVRKVLQLEPNLARRVEERTAGNPQFAVQLVRDWVQHGRLRPGEAGFELEDEAGADLPDDLHAAWAARVERLLDGLPDDAGAMLERAAVLGQEVSEADWRLACDDPTGSHRTRSDVFSPRGLRLRARLLERLLAGRLAVETEGGWAFANAMLRETLERRARTAGRWAAHHRACATLLRGQRGPGVAGRLGRHLVEAGDLQAAIDPWLAAIEELGDRGDGVAARRLVEDLGAVMARCGLPPSDRRWGLLWHQQAGLLFMGGEYEGVAPLSARLEEAAIAHGWADLRIEAILHRVRPALGRGRFAEAIGWCDEALRLSVELGDRSRSGMCRISLGTALAHCGRVQEAVTSFEAAKDDLAAAGDTQREGFAWRGLATAWRQLGNLDLALACFERARGKLEGYGLRYAAYECVNGIGDCHRMRGDLAAAERAYREALAGCIGIGSWHAVVIQVNLALTLVESRRFLEAYGLLADSLEQVEARGLQWLAAVVHVACLPCAAAEGDAAAWERHLGEGKRLLETTTFADADVARAAELAGDLQAQAGRAAEAAIAYGLAISQWRHSGRPDEARRVKEALRALA
jgi:serine/threonine protein kinase/tetratricopeptide (TPR) repeat protein